MSVRFTNTLKQTPINPYISWAFADQDLKKVVTNSLINPNFLVWQRYNNPENTQNKMEITYSDLIKNKGFTADCWYIKNYSFGSQSILITKEESLFNGAERLTNSIKISGGDQEVSSLGLNVSLSQNIESDKIFNLLNKTASISFYAKSSVVGSFTCALIIFDRENNRKYIARKPFYIREANKTQKVVLSFGSLTFPGLVLDRRSVAAEVDISVFGSTSLEDQNWITYSSTDEVITCLRGQASIFTGNNDYLQISNIGLQNGQPGHTIFPEYNPIDYYKDLLECQEFFERVFIKYLPVFYKSSDDTYSNWFAYSQMNTIKRNRDAVVTVADRESKINYRTSSESLSADISYLTNMHIVRDLGSLYNQKTLYIDLQSSLVASRDILYSYCNNLVLDIE